MVADTFICAKSNWSFCGSANRTLLVYRVREPVAQPRLSPLTELRTAILEKMVYALPVKAETVRGVWPTDALQFSSGVWGNVHAHVSVGAGHVQITRKAQVNLDAASQVSFNSCYLTLPYSLGLTDYTRLAGQRVPAFTGWSPFL